jgi:hypothetical protein
MDTDPFIKELQKKLAEQDRVAERAKRALAECDPLLRIAADLDEIEAPAPVPHRHTPPGAIRA